MKILLDECVPRRLKQQLPDHEVATVQEQAWSGIKDGELLVKAKDHFDIFITVDTNLAFQQNLAELAFPIIVLKARSNRLKAIELLVPELNGLLKQPPECKLYVLSV